MGGGGGEGQSPITHNCSGNTTETILANKLINNLYIQTSYILKLISTVNCNNYT